MRVWFILIIGMCGSLTSHALELCDGDQVNKVALEQSTALKSSAQTISALSDAEKALDSLLNRAHKIKKKLTKMYNLDANAQHYMNEIREDIISHKKIISSFKENSMKWDRRYLGIKSCRGASRYIKIVGDIQRAIAKMFWTSLHVTRNDRIENIERNLRFSSTAASSGPGSSTLILSLYQYTMYEFLVAQYYELYSQAVIQGYKFMKMLTNFDDDHLKELSSDFLPYFSEEKEKIEKQHRLDRAEEDANGITEEEDKKINPRESEF